MRGLRDGLSRLRRVMNPQTLPVIVAEAITRPNQIVNALLARAGRTHRDDDHVLILQANKRTPKLVHALGSRLESDSGRQRHRR